MDMKFWNANQNKQRQVVIVREIQMQDDSFHRTIIALERLETFLNVEHHKNNVILQQTAMGTSRDHHNDSEMPREYEAYYEELCLQCQVLYMCSQNNDKEVFSMAVRLFIENLLEWYAGRKDLEYYDEIDACIIPIIASISHYENDINAVFEKYVYKTKDISQLSLEDKQKAIEDGIKSIILGEYVLSEELKQSCSDNENMEIITSHKRGDIMDGFKRIIKSLIYLYDDSLPVKLFYKMINIYHPDIVKSLPQINEESLDRIFEENKKSAVGIDDDRDESQHEDDTMLTESKEDNNINIYPIVCDAIKKILQENGMTNKEITIEIKINIK